MLNFFVVAFVINSVPDKKTCSPYKCAPADYKMPSSYCSVSYNRTFFLSPCSSNEVCDLDTGKCLKKPQDQVYLKYPGEKCDKNVDCVYQVCANSTCKGLEQGQMCLSHEQCGPGMRCHEDKCQKQLDVTSSGCFSDYDCINSAGCNQGLNSIVGVCVGYFTVPIGQIVSDCITGTSYLCKTAECEPFSLLGSYGKCKLSITSSRPIPTLCSNSTECSGSDGIKKLNSMCVCGYNPAGQGYCEVFKGDLPGLQFFATWQKALISSLGVCNTMRRFSQDCLRSIGKYAEVLRATWNFYYFPLVQNNDECTQEMITYDAYIIDDFTEWMQVGLAIIATLF